MEYTVNPIVKFEPTALPELLGNTYDIHDQEQAYAAARELIEIGRKAVRALGEIIEVWRCKAQADDIASIDRLYREWAFELGVSKTTVVRAHVVATKFLEIERPEDVPTTTAYEILSGSDTPEEAEEGFNTALEQGYGVREVRVAKALKTQGHTDSWLVPKLWYDKRQGLVCTTDEETGEVVPVLQKVENGHPEIVNRAIAMLCYKVGM